MGLYYSQEPSLTHHGIKGQKWGVRRFQNPDGSLTAKGHQRYLNKLDSDLRSSAVSAYNLAATSKSAERKAKKLREKGKIEKAEKFETRSKNAKEAYSKVIQNYTDVGKKYIQALKDLDNSGYAWKVNQIDFAASSGTKIGRDFVKNNGRFSLQIVANAASGNRFKVREKVSDKKAEKWSKQRTIQAHKPQRVDVVFY